MKASATTDLCSAALPEKTGGPTPQYPTSLSSRILVVDDDPSIRKLDRKILGEYAYEVETAEDGDVAWNMLQFNSYDLVITENNLPLVSGIELIRKVRIARMAVPVMMVTRVSPREELAGNSRLQPAAMLLKPYTTDEFLRTVKAILALAAP